MLLKNIYMGAREMAQYTALAVDQIKSQHPSAHNHHLQI